MEIIRSRKEFEKKVQELIQQIKDNTGIFINDTPELQRNRINQALKDYFFFKETYFPHYATKPSGKIHRIWHNLTEMVECIIAIAGPRKHGKTVDLAVIKPIWKALKEDWKFIIFVSDNEDLAKERTTSIQCEFLYNHRLRQDFGEQFVIGKGEEDDFIIAAGTRFMALGWKQPIRGKIHGHYRPDAVIIDDFENHTSINLKIARRKLSYVRGDAFGALPDRGGIVIWLANLTHKTSAIAEMENIIKEENPDNIYFKKYKAIQDDGTPLWPEGFTLEQLQKLKATMGTIEFERHMQMNPIIEGTVFKAAWFKYASRYPKQFDRIVTAVDPSLGKNTGNDYKAIITIGIAKKLYWLLDCWIRKASINDMIRKMYQVDLTMNTRIYMESNFWQSILWEFIPPFTKDFGYLLPVNQLQNKLNKESRIEKLQPLYEFGWIIHPADKNEDIILLEEQLLNFPDHPNDDGPDAESMVIDCLKKNALPKEYHSVIVQNKFKNLF